MLNIRKFLQAIGIVPTASTAISAQGEMEVLSSNGKLNYHNGTTASPMVTEAHTAVLTNKTLSGNTATNLVSGSGTLTLNTSGTVTVPNATDTLVGKATTDILTNKSISGANNTFSNIPNSATTANSNNVGSTLVVRDSGGAFSAGNITANLIGNASTATSATTATTATTAGNVTGTVAIANGGTGQTTKTDAFDALSPNTTKGDVTVHNGTDNIRLAIGTNSQVLTADSTQSAGVKWANAPQGLKNYITTNADIEQGTTTGYGLGNVSIDSTTKFPSGTPTFGTGAAGSLSITAVNSGQLAGSYSLSYASSGATTAGDFVATDAFTVDLEGQAKVMQFKIAYQAHAGGTNGNFSGTSSNSFGIAIYDVTNSAWIQPAGVFNLVQNTGVGIATGTFQTTSNSTSYRLVFYNANASSGAITMYLDDFFVGPQITAQGVPASNRKADSTITPASGAFGTVSNSQLFRQQLADSLTVDGTFATGTVAGGTASISLPSGLAIDSSKMSTSGGAQIVGWANSTTSASAVISSSNWFSWIFYDGSDTSKLYFATNTASNTLTKATGANVAVSSSTITVHYTVPIAGWDSNTVMSNDTDTRVVAASYGSAAGTNIAATGTYVPFATKNYDTHSAWNGTDTYTVPVSGKYSVTLKMGFNSVSNTLGDVYDFSLYKNGSLVNQIDRRMFQVTSSSLPGMDIGGSVDVDCIAGDTLKIYGQTTGSRGTMRADATANYVTFKRLSGPATIAASSVVTASAKGSTTTLSTGAVTTLIFPTSVTDSHGSYSTSTGIYTVPVSGYYSVSSNVYITSGSFNNNVAIPLNIIKNGTVQFANSNQCAASTQGGISISVSGIISCNAGDTLLINAGGTSAWSGSAAINTGNLNIHRLGGVM